MGTIAEVVQKLGDNAKLQLQVTRYMTMRADVIVAIHGSGDSDDGRSVSSVCIECSIHGWTPRRHRWRRHIALLWSDIGSIDATSFQSQTQEVL